MSQPIGDIAANEASPLDDFSNCHVGILSHLHTFGELPDLLDAAARARKIAQDTINFFHAAIFDHHAEEEKDLFPIMLEKSRPGEERETVKRLVKALTDEHRDIEAQWRQLEPQLQKLIKGQPGDVDKAAVQQLVRQYQDHARLEEAEFLPLSAKILGRESADLAELGLSLHTRHVMRAARRGLRGS